MKRQEHEGLRSKSSVSSLFHERQDATGDIRHRTALEEKIRGVAGGTEPAIVACC